MGCGTSKVAAVAPEQAPQANKSPNSSNTSLTGSRQNVKVRPRNAWSNEGTRKSTSDSIPAEMIKVQECKESGPLSSSHSSSDVTSVSSRNSSATSGKSKGSSSSGDSGLGEDYADIVTERSDAQLKEIANLPGSPEVSDLTIEGLQVSKKRSTSGSKLRQRLEQAKSQPDFPSIPLMHRHVTFAEGLINELPDSPSILKRPVSRGGMAFDIMMGNDSAPQKPVLSSNNNSKRKKKRTYKELQEEQQAVEQRKKEHEQMIIERIRAKEERDRQVKEALDKFAEMQTELGTIKKKKEEETLQKREAYLNSLKDRLKEKSTHVEQIKKAKKVRKLAPLRPPRPNTETKDIPVNLGAN